MMNLGFRDLGSTYGRNLTTTWMISPLHLPNLKSTPPSSRKRSMNWSLMILIFFQTNNKWPVLSPLSLSSSRLSPSTP